MRLHKSVPNDLFYGHAIGGGLQFQHLWAATNREKASILQASLQDNSLDIYHIMIGGIRRLQQWCCTTSTPLRVQLDGLISLPSSQWLSSLWQWLTEDEITVGIPSMTLKPSYEGDEAIMEIYIDHIRTNLSSDDSLNLQHIERGLDVTVNTNILEAKQNISTLRKH